jgi:hypothetical protein
MEQHVTGVLHHSRRHRADILLNTGRALRLGGLINGKKRTRGRWKLIGSDSTLAKHIFRHRHRRHGIPSAGVEREMRDDLGDFAWLHAIVEREVEVVRHLDRLMTRDQGRHGNDAAVSWREIRALPQITEKKALRVSFKRRRDHPNILKCQHWRQRIRSGRARCLVCLGAG